MNMQYVAVSDMHIVYGHGMEFEVYMYPSSMLLYSFFHSKESVIGLFAILKFLHSHK